MSGVSDPWKDDSFGMTDDIRIRSYGKWNINTAQCSLYTAEIAGLIVNYSYTHSPTVAVLAKVLKQWREPFANHTWRYFDIINKQTGFPSFDARSINRFKDLRKQDTQGYIQGTGYRFA